MNIMLLVSLVSGAVLLLSVVNIYNYSVPLGEGNDTIMMYYDEPISEKRWQEMEEEEADERTDRGERNDRGDRAGRR